jgi:hypothetical protein
MAERLRAHLPRVALFVVLGLAATATLGYAAGVGTGSSPAPSATAAAPDPPLVVPDVKGQAFVFAKGSLEDAGFSWKVIGSVHGYAANTVVSQSPAPGIRVLDTGAPRIVLTLKRNSGYAQTGQAEDVSPYQASVVAPADLAAAVGPANPATSPALPVTTTAPAQPTTTAATTTSPSYERSALPAKPHVARQQSRPPAFTVPGGKKEPLDEMPLPDRAAALLRWLDAHPNKTGANVDHWLYQNAWIVTGAKLGWWHGAEALSTLIAADHRAERQWGIGAKSAREAQAALAAVKSRSK